MLPIPSRTTSTPLSTGSQKTSSDTVLLNCSNNTEAASPHECPLSSVPACARGISDNTFVDDEKSLDTRIIKAMYNAEFNKRNTNICQSPTVYSDNGSDSTMETCSLFGPGSDGVKSTKKVYFNEQVQFSFPSSDDQRGSIGGGLGDLRLVSDVKCFDGRSIYSLAGGCPGLWNNVSHAAIQKMVNWMTTSGLDIPSHRERARSYYSADDMSKDGYLC